MPKMAYNNQYDNHENVSLSSPAARAQDAILLSLPPIYVTCPKSES